MAERRLWTQFEDNALRYLREECQIQKWSEIASKMIEIFNITDRNQKQCRDRYTNSLNPNLNLNDWNEQDELLLIDCHKKYGNKWTIIAQKFKGRTDSFIKNHFYSRLRKCIRKLNRFIEEEFKKKYKKLNLNIIFKLTNLVQDKLTKISQDVREFYERLMYDLVNFSLKAEQGIRQYDAHQIETFVLALTSLQNLSGAIGANRKPKRGRGHKKEEKYLISTEGLCLVLLKDQLILRKEVDLQFEPEIGISGGSSQESGSNDLSEMGSEDQREEKKKVRFWDRTSESLTKPWHQKNSLVQKNPIIFQSHSVLEKSYNQTEKGHSDFVTKLDIEYKEFSKQAQLNGENLMEKDETILNDHEHSSYSDIMEYIMENSFDCGDNILSLSKQGSLEFDNLF